MTEPTVSIIVPCYNEQATIGPLLEAVHAQTYPRTAMEVVIADGLSPDGTRAAIARFQASHPELNVRVVDNPRRIIPAGLNLAIAAARGTTLVRLDAHSAPRPDYVASCLRALEAGRGDNVGGVWEIQPGAPGWLADSIAAAAAHPLGAGDALYRRDAALAQPVDTVPFGAFRRALIERIGGFDESLLTNEDYEFNARLRLSGGTVWLDPSIRSVYLARATLRGLAVQYARYGYWKWRMLRRYPGTLRLRQALPPLFVLALLIGSLAGLAWAPAGWLLLAGLGTYGFVLLLAGLRSALGARRPGRLIGLPAAIACMHLCWGGGFLWSMTSSLWKRNV